MSLSGPVADGPRRALALLRQFLPDADCAQAMSAAPCSGGLIGVGVDAQVSPAVDTFFAPLTADVEYLSQKVRHPRGAQREEA